MIENRHCRIVALGLTLGVGGFLPAQQRVQRIELGDLDDSRDLASFNVVYSAPGAPHLTGLGLRLHYSSSKLVFQGISEVLQQGLVGVSPRQPDTEDFDGNPRTDSYILVSWADVKGEWPGTESAVLYRVKFLSLTPSEKSPVRFTASSTAAGMEFSGQASEIGGPSNRWKARRPLPRR